ncbi:MAG: hypothetical protein KH703_00350 [Campylobacter gracilis]|uniref:hypothetical protein n=1 Tax=Campylobacter gracilis TaxID=824 RepID=UPI0026F378CA|nr:hypothetical protein [Campylobacter gracilis]MBS6151864.1 hypothetical protein [Campylobacter gracilis]
MFWILNRLRGQYSYFAKVNALVVALLIFAFYGNFFIAIVCGLGYLAGEAKGWGVWVGALTSHGADKGESKSRGIEWLAGRFIPRTRWLAYCRACLFLRGLIWWLPVFVPLVFAGVYAAPLLAVALAAGFPLACELGYRTKFSFAFKSFEVKTAWARQELFYGAMQDIAFLILWMAI